MEREKIKKMLLLHHPDKGGDRQLFEKYYNIFKSKNYYNDLYFKLKYKNVKEFLLNLNF